MKIMAFSDHYACETSRLISRTLHDCLAQDYSSELLKRIEHDLSPHQLIRLSCERFIILAIADGYVIGTGAIQGNWICSVYVAMESQRKGTGTKIMKRLEEVARTNGIIYLRLHSSVGAVPFYERLGFRLVGRLEQQSDPLPEMSRLLI